MKALAIIALAIALEAGFLLTVLFPAAPSGAYAPAVARPFTPTRGAVPATAATACDGGPRC